MKIAVCSLTGPKEKDGQGIITVDNSDINTVINNIMDGTLDVSELLPDWGWFDNFQECTQFIVDFDIYKKDGYDVAIIIYNTYNE